jgi:hypothetical protein
MYRDFFFYLTNSAIFYYSSQASAIYAAYFRKIKLSDKHKTEAGNSKVKVVYL